MEVERGEGRVEGGEEGIEVGDVLRIFGTGVKASEGGERGEDGTEGGLGQREVEGCEVEGEGDAGDKLGDIGGDTVKFEREGGGGGGDEALEDGGGKAGESGMDIKVAEVEPGVAVGEVKVDDRRGGDRQRRETREQREV